MSAVREVEPALLEIAGVTTGYGRLSVLRELDLVVPAGAVTALIGANGAGKTTLLRAISGLLPVWEGEIRFAGRPIGGAKPYAIAAAGIAHVPEGRRLFPRMSVADHLDLGAYRLPDRARRGANRDRVLELFPVLGERRRQVVGTLSGGEQQMVAIGRALMSDPVLLLMDEPTQGLMPLMVDALYAAIARIHESGVTVLLVEQDVDGALGLAERGYVLESGRIVLSGEAAALRQDARVRDAYLGS